MTILFCYNSPYMEQFFFMLYTVNKTVKMVIFQTNFLVNLNIISKEKKICVLAIELSCLM